MKTSWRDLIAPRGCRLRTIIVTSILGVCVNFPEGYSNTYPNTSFHSFREFLNETAISRGFHLSDEVYTWVWSAILNVWHLGFLIGNMLIPLVAENFGRKNSLVLAAFISLACAIASFLSIVFGLPEVYFCARAVTSVAGGISFGTLIIFLQETTPTHLRGVSSFLAEVTFLLCTVVGMGAGMDRIFGRSLTILTAVAIVPAILSVLVLLPLKEGPKFLLLVQDDQEAAEESIMFYYGDDVCPKDVISEIAKESLDDDDDTIGLVEGVKLIFTEPHLRMPYFIGMFSLQLVMSLFPMIYLSTEFLEKIFDSDVAQLASFGFIVCQFLAGIPGTFVVARCGRRPIILWLGLMNVASLCLYVIFDRLSEIDQFWGYGCVVALCIFGVSYGIGLGPIACFITSELVVQRYRSIVQSMMFVTNTAISLFISYATLPAFIHFGVWAFVPLFILPSFGSLFYLYKNLPETKDREIYDIVSELRARTCRSTMGSRSYTAMTTSTMSSGLLKSESGLA